MQENTFNAMWVCVRLFRAFFWASAHQVVAILHKSIAGVQASGRKNQQGFLYKQPINETDLVVLPWNTADSYMLPSLATPPFSSKVVDFCTWTMSENCDIEIIFRSNTCDIWLARATSKPIDFQLIKLLFSHLL